MLEKFGVRSGFRRIVALEDVKRSKPDAEGLRRILDGRPPQQAVYLGDNVDDAWAARRAGIFFLGVSPRTRTGPRLRAAQLKRWGAQIVLSNINELEKWLR